MTLQKFAEQHRLRTTMDSCGEKIIQGRLYKDANISEYGDKLCICWLTGVSRKGKFNTVRKACEAAGMVVVQEGDNEAIFTFDPENTAQARLAISSIRAKVKKVLSPERVAALTATLAAARSERHRLVA